nr:NTP transferase domain-containing protein [Agreia sp. COWG]
MLLDAIVLAGGRSSRLAGVPKSELVWQGRTLLEHSIQAAARAGSRRVVVVGPDTGCAGPAPAGQGGGVVLVAREDPPFAGPAAAIAAGLAALEGEGSGSDSGGDDAVLVLACDMPLVSEVVDLLVAAAESLAASGGAGRDGHALVDAGGRRQPLAAIYRRASLAEAVQRLRASGRLVGGSMRSIVGGLHLVEVVDSLGVSRDVDTWEAAAQFGIQPKKGRSARGASNEREGAEDER